MVFFTVYIDVIQYKSGVIIIAVFYCMQIIDRFEIDKMLSFDIFLIDRATAEHFVQIACFNSFNVSVSSTARSRP